ncbi:MAG: hypothetical protein AAGI07_13310 [Bacteroidota bacterium]
MKFTHFTGIDISKDSYDVCFCSEELPDQFIHSRFANSAVGCKQLLTWLKKHKVFYGTLWRYAASYKIKGWLLHFILLYI